MNPRWRMILLLAVAAFSTKALAASGAEGGSKIPDHLRPVVSLSGTVVDETGWPVEGAAVAISPRYQESSGLCTGRLERTPAAGTFRILRQVDLDDCRLAIVHPDFA